MTKKKINNSGELIIYTGPKGGVELRADTDKETIWASLDQIASLFERDKSVISRHLRNIFREKELDRNSVVAKNATTAADGKTYMVKYYNLDVVLSVGYRVNSKQATLFRQWTTKTLREYLTKGIVVNAKRLEKLPDRMIGDMLEKYIFIQRIAESRELNKGEVDGLFSVISSYAHSWKFLKEYDEGELTIRRGKTTEKRHFDYEFVRSAINQLKTDLIKKDEASELFASERDGSLFVFIRRFALP